ncbi:MAG: acyl-CoA dehydrogenase family protein [Acidimicrobiales bacterium]|jgi:alkylation response protein AidB-like acyl-CoA dehydrogenase|nr:acyl-CoA dehydrogenase family protein [Acidimicrobiales bacterium]
MDFSLRPETERFRDQVRAFIAEHVTPEVIERMHETGTFHDWGLSKALADAGLLAGALPGAGDRDPVELWILFNELEKAGAPYDGLAVTMMVGGIINTVGTDFHRREILDQILTGTKGCALGYSEPDFGSDVAGAMTRAERDGDEWVINGQKMWTSLAHEASWVILLTRTDPEVPKHKGLTMFMVPLDLPGVEIQPVHTMGSERTNATFYDNVRIPDRYRLGEVNGGWAVMAVGLAFERGVMGGTNTGVPLLRHTAEWVRHAHRPDGTRLADDPVVREQLVRVAIDNHVAGLLTVRCAWIAATGGLPGLEGSMTKVFATEAYQKAVGWFQRMAGAEGLLGFGTDGAAEGWIDYDARHAPVTTIYGGTSEINRNNIAERHLGLPRAR